MTQVFTFCNPELQNHIPFHYRLWSTPSISRQSATQYSRSQTLIMIFPNTAPATYFAEELLRSIFGWVGSCPTHFTM